MINQIALFTAVIATVGALFWLYGRAHTSQCRAVQEQRGHQKKPKPPTSGTTSSPKAPNRSLAELARDLAPEDKKAFYQGKIDRYEKEKNDIKLVADKLEAEATAWDEQSDAQMHQHHRWAQSTTVLQVSIALAAIALLTKKKWLEVAMFVAGGAGLLVGVLAALHI